MNKKKKTSYFVEAMQKTIIKKITTDNNYFIAPSFNQLILDGKLIGVHKINNRDYIPLKNEKQTNDKHGKRQSKIKLNKAHAVVKGLPWSG